jgi:catechol 2,3-dioxygenase-like lactoylglutathione lyase family enzyme
MSSRIRHVTIDCHDPYSQAAFWADVLGFVEDQDNPNAPDDPEALITDPSGRHPGLLFIKVPDAKAVKNRVHVDLVPAAMRDETVVALLARGATLVDDHRRADGTGWAVLADPEGNEFCVERSDAERGITPPSDTGSDQDYPDGIRTADERQMLSDMLDWYRDAVLRKVDGISPVTARTSPVRSGTTIAGLLKHLALVEDSWFTERFAGVDDLEPWVSAPWDDDPDWEFHSAATDPVEDVVSLYRAACDRSRTAAAGHALDDPATSPGRREFTLRFAFVHLIEETARHLGHMDILREFLDGSIGE